MTGSTTDTQESLRVIAFTTIPPIANAFDQMLAALGHRLVALVTTPGPERRRSTGYAEIVREARPNLDILVTSHPRRLAGMLAPLRPDLIVCGSFPWRLPLEVLQLPRLGAINAHPAALPKYRGPNSMGWAIRNGEREIGLTVHRMDGDFDTGPILAQATIPVYDDDTAQTVFARLGPLGFSLFPEAIQKVLDGDPGLPQDESKASQAPLFDESERRIDWTRPARDVHNLVRSCRGLGDVTEGALGTLDARPFRIGMTRLIDAPHDDSTLPGTVLTTNQSSGEMVVQCGDGPLAIVESTLDESALER